MGSRVVYVAEVLLACAWVFGLNLSEFGFVHCWFGCVVELVCVVKFLILRLVGLCERCFLFGLRCTLNLFDG